MPIFEFKCQSCNHVFEKLLLTGQSDAPQTCPQCQSNQVQKLISAPFIPSAVGKPANDELRCCAGKKDAGECTPGACCANQGPVH